MEKKFSTLDGNEAIADVAYRVNEVAVIYPITPASPIGEWADAWSAEGRPNIWGTVPSVVEMQSEGGAAGAVHGALQAGSICATFTASQGLLLMIPNMYKISGELTPTVFHIAARSIATHALSIFGDHSDVMAVRGTGFGLIASASVQEGTDIALIAQAASFESRIPFIHFFDGFRTSHEVSKVELLSDDILKAMISDELIAEHRKRALSPEHPCIRGTAQNPDVFFQCRETINPFYDKCAEIVQKQMDKFAKLTGRQYNLFDYYGAPDAEYVVVIMASGCEAAHETVDYLTKQGKKVGVLKVRLYRPFDVKAFISALPATVKAIAVLDRCKEPGSAGDPLHIDCLAALSEGMNNGWAKFSAMPKVIGGRYGLSSKEFTPAMVKGVFDNLAQAKPKNHFTVGINDDVSHTSIPYDPEFSVEPESVVRAMFYGLGADGTVGANKNSIKIIGENTENFAHGYFVYDSKKSGAMTISHLRFGPHYIRSNYLINKASFIACHQPVFLDRYDMLKEIVPGGTFLLNTHHSAEEVFARLPRLLQERIISMKVKFYVIDGYKVAKENDMGAHINTVMQVCFFAISGVLPRDKAIEAIKEAIRKTFSRKGEEVVKKNIQAVDNTLQYLHEVKVPGAPIGNIPMRPPVPDEAPEFVRSVLAPIMARKGDDLPVSAFPVDGTFPSGTTRWEKRSLALEIPTWDPDICLQCGKCAIVCPHAVIRHKAYDPEHLTGAPAAFKAVDAKDRDWKGMKFSIQISPEDCTGCGVCVEVCPAKNKSQANRKALNMDPIEPLRAQEQANWKFFANIPETDRRKINVSRLRQQQVQQPLFEFSGACAGCGETPYLKLITQLFGDRMMVANATGCSSIYGGNLPTTPWAYNQEGRGPAWANSLFEDNAEFGLGMKVAYDKQREFAGELLKKLAADLGDGIVKGLLEADQKTEAGIYEQRQRVAALKEKLAAISKPEAKVLLPMAEVFIKRSFWIVGGDGWAYDIGFGGLDHVLASGRDVNILVLDSEVYSNTGGQMSKATPRAAIAKFAAAGKRSAKKDLGLIAMTYGNVYVASVAMGARDEHTLKALIEAESYEGPSIVIAYSHCIAHGIPDMRKGMEHEKAAVDCGQWLLYRFDPRNMAQGKSPLSLDSKPAEMPVEKYFQMETRFRMLTQTFPDAAKTLFAQAQEEAKSRYDVYQYIADCSFGEDGEEAKGEES